MPQRVIGYRQLDSDDAALFMWRGAITVRFVGFRASPEGTK